MSWGLLIAPHGAAHFARPPAVPPAPQRSRHKARGAAALLAVLPMWTRTDAPDADGMPRRSRGLTAFALLAMMSATNSAQAQPLALAPVHVDGPAPSCVDVQVEGARSLSYDCLNQNLKDTAQQQTGTPPAVTAKDAAGTGAPTTVGTFSYTGTSIRMGNAFGRSAAPQRPPAPSFTSALAPQHGAR